VFPFGLQPASGHRFYLLLYINNYVYTQFNNKSDLVCVVIINSNEFLILYRQVFLLRLQFFYKPKEIILKSVFYRISVRHWK
jgi:hypothetical protein